MANLADLYESSQSEPTPTQPRGIWDRFKDAYLSGALHSPFGAEGLARLYLKSQGHSDEEINAAEKRISDSLAKRQSQDSAIQGSFKSQGAADVGRGAVDLLGNLLGGVDPTYALSPGKNAVQRIASQGAINAGMDAASQGVEVKRGVRDRFDPLETGLNAAAGAVFQGGSELSGLVRTIKGLEGGGTLEQPLTSPKGALGPMQVMPETARDPGFGIRPWNGKSQKDLERVGIQYAAAMNNRYDGDPAKVLAAYNAGPGAVDKAVRLHGEDWLDHMPLETRKYVNKGTGGKMDPYKEAFGASSEIYRDKVRQEDIDRLLEVDKRLNEISAESNSLEEFDAHPETKALFSEYTNLTDPLTRNSNVIPIGRRDPLVELENLLGDIQSGRKEVLTPAERQDMDASVPDYETPPEAVDARTIGQGAEYPEQIPANENPDTVSHKFVNVYGDKYTLEQQKNPNEWLLKNEQGQIESGFHGQEEDVLDHMEFSGLLPDVKPVKDLNGKIEPVERDQNPPAQSSTFGTRLPEGINRKPPTKSPEGHDSNYEGLSPTDKLRKGIKAARPAAAEQKKLIHEARQRQAAVLQDMQRRGSSYEEELGALRGSLPGADYEPIRQHFSDEEVNALEQMINQNPRLRAFEKVTAKKSLHKLLNPNGVKVPTHKELRNLADVFGSHVIQDILDKEKPGMTIGEATRNVVNAPKVIQASTDISAPARQALPFIGRKEFWKNYPKMIQIYANRLVKGKAGKAYDEAMESIKDMETYSLMKQAGIKFTGKHFLEQGEEYFADNFAEKIPGYGTRVIKGSDEAYSGYLNLIRAHVFQSIYKAKLARGDRWTTAQLKALGEYVNVGSGRGSLGRLEASANNLNAAFFSPRLIASRVKLLNPAYAFKLYRTDPFLARQYARDMGSLVLLAGTTLTLASQMGFEVETDPRSTDFAKIKNGTVRVDMLGGFQPYLRLIAQELTGEKKNVNTGKIKPIGPSPLGPLGLVDNKEHTPSFGDETRGDVAINFFGNKLAPVPAFLWKWATQSKYRPFKAGETALSMGAPMWVPDLVKSIQKDGVKGAWILAPDIIGFGVQDYDEPKRKKSSKGGSSTKSPVEQYEAMSGSSLADQYERRTP